MDTVLTVDNTIGVVNPTLDDLAKIASNEKLNQDIINEKERIKIAKLDCLKWVIGTEIPNKEHSFGSETVYESAFDEIDMGIIKNKVMEIVKSL